ncbi:anti-sigma factor antagonist [uncultured Methanoregula sp.]|uniref:anti-sigma factor antagonist n=1 Tax=uncultured Methanoregula sp. TaxID=1005933 RepID=UPI002AAAB99E|nr:anti-sigma factor antagonist [uncultured Methanoregula sp.]
MEYRFLRTDTAALFILDGRIDASGSIRLDTAVKEHVVPADRAVLFDMAGVSYMSSAGIRVFMGLEKALRERDGHLLLCSVQPAVLKVLEITGFDRVFTLCSTRDEALHRCRLEKGPAEACGETAIPEAAHVRLSAESFPDYCAVLKVSGSEEKICAGILDPEDLMPRIFTPGEYSMGIGDVGESAAESFPDRGMLLTTGNAIFWKPFESPDPPDFLIPRKDAPRVLLNCAFSAAVDGQFHEILVAGPVRPEGFSLSDIFSDIAAHARASRKNCPPIISMVMYAGINDLAGTPDACSPGKKIRSDPLYRSMTLVSFGIGIDTTADLSAYDHDALDLILCQNGQEAGRQDLFLYQTGLVFDAPPTFTTRDISRLVATTCGQEPCIDLVRLSAGTLLSRAVLGVTYLSAIEHTGRMPIRIAGECPGWNRTFETITRWLHPGCRDIELIPLTGGFSGTLVFRVNARDSRGRSMMPLVMKLGKWPVIEDEIRGYTDHVKRYIQNNATQIIETERLGEYGGILYNFVGIRGPDSNIFSLEDFYLSRTTDEILPVFDALFRVVLRGWYGDPKKKEIALYQEYNRFWKYEEIRAYAASKFGADPGEEEIELPFGLGRSTNPLWFVEKVMPERLSWLFEVYESSVHGDLNMKNVLMDETGNLWLIDFAETRYSHILRDIVKLEAVLKGEMVKTSSRETLAELVSLDVPFLSARTFSDIPELPHTIRDPALEKAFRCVRKLREYADMITPGDGDISQYYLGLLPYTLNLLSYTSVNEYEKEYGWITASLICRRLMESGPFVRTS